MVEHGGSDVVFRHGDVSGSGQLDCQRKVLNKFFNFIPQVRLILMMMLVVKVYQSIVLFLSNPFVPKRSSTTLATCIHVSSLTS